MARKPAAAKSTRVSAKPTRTSNAVSKRDRVSIADSGRAAPRVSDAQKARALRLLAALQAEYPEAKCSLDYANPHELLIATILSAQSTDVGVNKATPALFARFRTPQDFANATPAEIEPFVKSCGFYRNKARAIHEAMKAVVETFAGEVPRTMEELLTLRGVARKTANVVLGNAFGVNVGFVVDTHIERFSQRMALAPKGSTVAVIEQYLMAQFPRDQWCQLSHQIIAHGRAACKARGNDCSHPICREFGTACECRASMKAARDEKPVKSIKRSAIVSRRGARAG